MPKKKDQKENVEVKKVVQEEGTIVVTRTTVVSGKEVESEGSQEVTKIEVRPFLCQPAYASIKMGETIPLIQPYASRKIDVNVSHPCYKEELPQVLKDVAELVDSFLDAEIAKVTNAAIPRITKSKTKTDKKTANKEKRKKKTEPVVEEEKDDLDDLLLDDAKAAPDGEDTEVDDDDDLAALL